MIRRDVEDLYPLSPAQQGILFHSLLEPASGVYVGQVLYRLAGALDEPALERTLERALAALPALRTAFVWEGVAEPVQVVMRQVEVPVERRDWRRLPEDERQRRLDELMREDRRRGFDFAAAPLVRFHLLRGGDAEWQLLWSFHHLVLDGWSVPLVADRIFALYRAFAAGEPEPALPPVRPYRDYIGWLRGRDLAAAEAFWRAELAGVEEPTPLGVDGHLPPAPPAGGDEGRGDHRSAVAPGVTATLRQLGQRHRLTLNTFVQGAWAILLSRYSRSADVLFGVTAADRPTALAGAEGMVGLFINTLPLRARVAPGERLFDWLAALQAGQAEVREHQHVPLVEVQRWSGVAGRSLFESILVFESFPVARSESGGGDAGADALAVRRQRFVAPTHYALTLLAHPAPELGVVVESDPSRVGAAAAGRLAAHLVTLLEAMAAAGDDSRLGELSHLPADERRRIAATNDTAVERPAGATLHGLIAARAAADPRAVAVEMEGRTLTHGELADAAGRLARRLVGLGVVPGEVVGVAVERSPELSVGLLAILQAGAAYLPLDAELPAERLAFMAADAGCRFVLTRRESAGSLPPELAAGRRLVAIDAEEGVDAADAAPAGAAPPTLPPVDPEAVAYVIYTSGSTGRPKGAAVPHRAIVNRLLWMQEAYPLDGTDCVLQKTPIGFDVSVWELFWPLLAGARLLYARPGGHRDTAYLARLLREGEVTTAHFVPSLLAAFLDEPAASDLPALRRVVASGEALTPALVGHFFRRLPGVELHNLYGPTEAAVDVSAWACSPADAAAPTVPIGRPIANVALHVLDRDLDPVGFGVPGELAIGGVALAHGYVGRPALTAARFVPDALSGTAGARLYRTGDLARLRADGAIEFLGRLDHQVKLRGHRVEPGEIEAVLAEHPAVRECAVTMRPGAAGDARLVAHVVLRAGAAPSRADLAAHLAARLPEVMVPSAFVIAPELPKTASGKVDRKALPDAAPPAGAPTRYAAPLDPGEELLAALWEQVLGRQAAGERGVGRDDDFFQLGGHSILALRLLSRLRQALGVELGLADLFAHPTLAGMAGRVDAALRGAAVAPPPPILPAPRDLPLPLSYAQQRLWFLDQLEPGSAAYNVPLALRIEGELETSALAGALAEAARRHEVLRTRFVVVDGEPRQAIAPAPAAALPVIDLAALPPPRRERAERVLAQREARLPFDLAAGRPLRATLLRRGEAAHTLLVTVHHIATDAWSMGLLLREVSEVYAAIRAGRPADLPPLPLQVADHAVWERGWLTAEAIDGEVAWWRERLGGGGEVLELPLDRPRPAVQSHRGGHLAFDLPGELVAGLDRLARDAGATRFMVLLAGWQALLHRYGGQTRVRVGTTTSGRERPEVAGLVGCFVNTLVLATDLEGDPAFAELLERVREVVASASAHQTLPFERLVEELAPERDLSTTPLFQAVLTLHQGDDRVASLPGATVSSLPVDSRTAKFDLELEVSWRGGAARANLEYAADLFDRTTVRRLAAHLQALLAAAAAQPATPLSRLPLLAAAERFQLLREWNDSRTPVPAERTFAELFAEQARRAPDRVAASHGDAWLSYGELDRRADRLARHLVAGGFGPEQVVALFAPRDLATLIAILAVFKAGGAYTPLDPLHPPRRLAAVLAASGARRVLVARELAGELEGVLESTSGGGAIPGERPEVLEIEALAAADAPAVELPAGDPRHLAYVIFTSGSTGMPKGAMIEQRGMVNHLFCKVLDLGLDGGDCVAQSANLSFDVSVWQFLVALLVGGRTDVFDDEQALDPHRLMARLDAQGVTVVETVPSQLRVLLEEVERGGARPPRLARLRWMIPNGEVLPPELCRRWLAAYPKTAMINAYGPTECSDDVLHQAIRRPPDARLPVPIGRPLPNLRLYVLDRRFQPLPIGVPGDLYVAGAGVGRGYLGDPRRTAATFVPDPLADRPGGRLYRTGDRGRWLAGGRLDFLGRVDFQVKIRGFRIEIGDVEAALAAHPAVAQAAVVARRHGGDDFLCAYLVPERGAAGDGLPLDGLPLDDVRRHLGERLPPYMMPARFVELERLPLTVNGKLDRKALPEPGAPEAVGAAYEAPAGELEERVAAAWREVLAVERVGRHDDFFGLGGHSLAATRVTIRLSEALGMPVPVRALFLRPTVAQLAASLGEARNAAASAQDAERRIVELKEKIARLRAAQEVEA